MNSLADPQLLREYAEHRSEAAFAEFVRRHVDFVYSAALRMVRDAHVAEDITQGVFLAVARNARQLMEHPVLSGWLHRTTQNLAAKIVRSEVRRRAREQEAVAMNELQEPDAVWEQVAPHLDNALGELSEGDRNALLLRYFQRQSAREMAQTLGTSEDAAQKRVSRAVERLRELFVERGVTVGVAGLVVVLSTNAVQAAPVGLGTAISSTAITSTATLTKATVVTAKLLAAKAAAALVAITMLLGIIKLLVWQSTVARAPAVPAAATPAAAKPAAPLPIQFANDAFISRGDARFRIGVDPLVRRTNGSAPAGHIKSLIDPAGPGSADYLRVQSSRFALLGVAADSPLFGKRIRLTGWIKTREVDNWAGFQLMIRDPAGKIIAVDEMMDRPIRATTDWQQCQMVADVPREVCFVNFGPMLFGTGELWTDDFQIDVVSTNTPITDDRRWHKWSPNAADYSVALDPENPHDGHPTLRLAFTPEGPAPRGSWMWWGQCIREPENYAGHTVHMTVWIKCENASGTAGINLRPKGPNFALLTEDKKPRRHVSGTTGWVQRSIFCAIPEETQCLDTGFYFNGSGKLWIDMESLRYDILDNDPPAAGVKDFTSNIPVIVLRGDRPGPVSGTKTYSAFNLELYEPGNNGPARLGDAPTIAAHVGLRLHGMVSRQFPKLSYRVKLKDDLGASQGRPLLGMPADADWLLQGPWLDKSLIRNALSYDLARAMGCAAMRTRPCEVFLSTSGRPVTDADYLGVYQLTEHIERGEERVNVTKLGPDENSEPAVRGGYILAWDVGEGTYLPSWKSIQVKYPAQPSAAQVAWIDGAITRFDKALKGGDFRDPVKGYATHIEVDDWVNYVLFEELIFNLDAYIRSFYLQKDRGGKIRPGPVWDHDLAVGHQFPQGTSFTDWWYVERHPPHGWITRLMADPDFSARMARRWAVLRKGDLSDAQIAARVDTIAAPLLPVAADRNFQRWKILNEERPFPKPDDYITIATATYPEQIAALKKFLRIRAAWMDANLGKDIRP